MAKGIDVDRAMAPMLKQVEAFRCRALETTAKMALRSLWVAQESYRAEHDRYDKDLKKIGFDVKSNGAAHRIVVTKATKSEFVATATGLDGDLKGEIWEIDQTGTARQLKAVCGK